MSEPPDTSTPPPPRPPSTQPPPPPMPAGADVGPEAEMVPGAWTGGRTLFGLAVLLAIVIASAAVVVAFDPDIETLGARLTLQVLLAAAMIGVAFAVANPAAGGIVPAATLGLRRPLRGAIGPSLIAYFAYIGCALVINALLEPEQEDVTRELGVDESAFGAIAAGVLIIGAAPLAEEIFFRGFMFAGLKRSGGFLVGALVSSAVWGLFHYTGPDSWGVCLQLALFGVILCWLYQRTGSIWPPIAVHAFNNALAFTLLTST